MKRSARIEQTSNRSIHSIEYPHNASVIEQMLAGPGVEFAESVVIVVPASYLLRRIPV